MEIKPMHKRKPQHVQNVELQLRKTKQTQIPSQI